MWCFTLASYAWQVQVRKRKWDSYSSGEELFGLSVTQYEGLQQTEKELVLLNRLYLCVLLYFPHVILRPVTTYSLKMYKCKYAQAVRQRDHNHPGLRRPAVGGCGRPDRRHDRAGHRIPDAGQQAAQGMTENPLFFPVRTACSTTH